jgi:lactate permease
MVALVAGGWGTLRRLLAPTLVIGAVMGAVQFVVAVSGPWNVAAFIGALAGLLVGFPLAYRTRQNGASPSAVLDRRALLVALSGYAALIFVTLGVLLIPAVKDFLGQVVLQVQFPETSTSLGYVTPAGTGRKINIFGHTGSLLLYSSILAYLIYRWAGCYKPGAVRRILDGTLRRVMSSSVSIASMVAMAVVMEHAGMTDTLARGLAEGMGALFPFMAPWIGALGAFMTGSNTNSNVVFGGLQMRTAELLGFAVPVILAAQTAGAALASVIAPTKVVVGVSTVKMAGKEGEVMRTMGLYVVLLVLLISALTILFA